MSQTVRIKRISAKKKEDIVLRLLQGEDKLHDFTTLEEAAKSIGEFIELYKKDCMLQRLDIFRLTMH